ncbi:hypothetical protein EVAR_23111_1 [Eumeta japonica]|uniref:Uncharacterized protein n=1 Tax=Eumeta variegata TaxID=151549 RepID=A0A4C1VPU7_EUMVA|nr:hypothetical protein EVAR_23111_1 [Eumeta japonica]
MQTGPVLEVGSLKLISSDSKRNPVWVEIASPFDVKLRVGRIEYLFTDFDNINTCTSIFKQQIDWNRRACQLVARTNVFRKSDVFRFLAIPEQRRTRDTGHTIDRRDDLDRVRFHQRAEFLYY